MNFDAWEEQVHLEKGLAFGIPPKIWYALSHAAESAEKYAGIEPIIFEPLEGGRPGGTCTFYSPQFEYKVWIHMAAQAGPVVGLSVYQLDDPTRPRALIPGDDANDLKTWRRIVLHMLEAEGFQGMSYEELQAWNQEHNLQ